MQENKHIYGVELKWTEDRKGLLHSEDLYTEIEVATPPEFPGGVKGVWSPEHLFIASVSSCFMTTFLAIAELSKLDYSDLLVSASGLMDKPDGKFEITEIILKPLLTIDDESKTDKALRILEKAEQNCLITRSIRSKVKLEAEVQVR